jgi:putative transposase
MGVASCGWGNDKGSGLRKGATGANPTDRGKSGVKRSLLTDGAGIPLAIVIDGANRHDVKLLCATLDGIVIARPEPIEEQPQHLCLDAGYAGAPARNEVETRHYIPHIRSRGAEKQEKVLTPGHRARRWVVERTHSWINRSRRLLVRWEKKEENYLAFLHLACAQLIFAKVEVFG